MRGHQHGHAGSAALAEFLLHNAGMDGIETDHGLVDHEHLRFVQQGAGDGEALPGAVAEVLDALMRALGEVEFFKQLGTEPQTQAGVFEVAGKAFSIGIEGTGSLRAAQGAVENEEEEGGGGLQQIRPRVYVRFKEILALCLVALAAGFVLLYRKGAAKA